MSTRTLIPLVLYTREGCHLCEEMLAVVESLRAELALDVQCIDIGGRPDLEARFGTEIPVLFVAGRKAFKYRVTPVQLRARIQRARPG